MILVLIKMKVVSQALQIIESIKIYISIRIGIHSTQGVNTLLIWKLISIFSRIITSGSREHCKLFGYTKEFFFSSKIVPILSCYTLNMHYLNFLLHYVLSLIP